MRRTMLFIPGNSPAMLLNADVHGSDAIILDLEDAVAPSEKDAARILVRNAVRALSYQGAELIVRVNPIETAFCREDMEAVVPLRPSLIMPTKVADENTIHAFADMLDELEEKYGVEKGSIGLIPLLETAEGIENAYRIAKASPRVKALFLGAEDLSSDLRAKRTKEGKEIAYSRGRILSAARAAGVDVYDTPFTDVNDDEGLIADATLARELGFTGKAAISPRYVEGINRVFSPSEKEIDYAREVLDAIEEGKRQGKGAVSLHGKMIDKPIVDRALYVLEMAKALGVEV